MIDESIPLGMRPYYQEYNAFFYNAYDEAPCFTIGVADISKGIGKQFKAMKKQDEIPSLTTAAWDMSVWGIGDDGRRKAPSCGRYLTIKERAKIYGFDGELLLQHISPRGVHAALANTVVLPNMERIMKVVLGHVNAVIKMDYEQIVQKRITWKPGCLQGTVTLSRTSKRSRGHATATSSSEKNQKDLKKQKAHKEAPWAPRGRPSGEREARHCRL